MTPSAERGNGFIGYARKQRATAYNTMPFAKWNELLQKSTKIGTPKKSEKRG